MNISYGCGTPAGLQSVRPGETVLDIGSGGGIDCFEALRLVGPSGRVISIDITDSMLAVARHHAQTVASNLGHASTNVEFRKEMADAMPIDDARSSWSFPIASSTSFLTRRESFTRCSAW
ncbi:methyltransferase domain-containing protein [Nitrospira sp. KM1]|uniref:methyltransferase domain-containing protein n=1 Tax=Nitrospira sp. KM1 TaxID=1936990 RepID=UPI0015639CE5